MDKKFFEGVYKATLNAKLHEAKLDEMAVVNTANLRPFIDLHPEILDLYRTKTRGSKEDAEYRKLADEYFELYPEELAKAGKPGVSALADKLHPIVYPKGKNGPVMTTAAWTSGKTLVDSSSTEAQLDSIITLIKQAQNKLDMAGFGDSEAAAKFMDLLNNLDDLKVVPAPEAAVDETPDAEPTVEPEVEPETPEAAVDSEPEPSSDDPFAIAFDEDDSFLNGNDDDDVAGYSDEDLASMLDS